jgi:thiol-disulfide isomerase/thioredoxin
MKKFLFTTCILFFGIYQSQTYYSQNFNTPGLNGWVSKDLDGDGKNWGNLASNLPADFGAGALASFSYNASTNTALHPDNLVTSPLIDLSTVTSSNVYLLFDQAAKEENYPNEKYSVYITNSNIPAIIIAATPAYTETLAQGNIQSKAVNLTSFIGQQVYVSFRHYDCTDQYALLIDNVQVKTLENTDVALKKVSLNPYGIVSTDYSIKATVKNNGVQAANTVTINWNDGVDHSSVIPLTTPLTTGQEKVITLPIVANYSSSGEKNINVSITGVNGSPDSNPADNTLATKLHIVSQNSPKKVVIEEGTGTWCGYCPRGAVAMHNTEASLPNDFIGITVHNNDPMQLNEYNSAADFQGFPSINVDRSLLSQEIGTDFSPVITERKSLIVPAALNLTSSLAGRIATLNASAIFRTNFTNANFRFAVVIIEDGVKGTTSNYNQINYYAGGATPMGGYENKPNPVPAADMTYNHVGRMLIGGYNGQAGSIPAVLTDGQVVNYTFTADIPVAYNLDNVKAALLLLDNTTGEIVNAAGPFTLSGTLATHEAKIGGADIALYPNPAKDYIKIQAKGKVDLKVIDVNGRILIERSDVEPDTSVSVQNLIKGTYIVSIKEKGTEPKTKKLIIK